MTLPKSRWFYLPINPVQWEVGPLSVGRGKKGFFPKMGRSENLHAFQEEVREWFDDHPTEMLTGDLDVHFWFWQRLDTYVGPSGKHVTKKAADATNMQKATEDALQKILFDNDRSNRKVGSEIVAQGKDVNPGIVIRVCSYISNVDVELPGQILSARLNNIGTLDRKISDNSWPPAGGF